MQRNKEWFFSQNPLFGKLPTEELDRVASQAESRTCKRREILWSAGPRPDRVWFIRSGLVKVYRATGDGRELTLHLLQKNDIVGESFLFGEGECNSTAEIYEECVLVSLKRSDFLALLKKYPSLVMGLVEVMAERRRSLENRTESLIFRTAHSRLASLFLDLADRFGVKDARGVIVNMKITHKEMASFIGASRETVSFAILDLRKDGLILTEEKRVVLLDVEKLRRLAAS